MLRTRTTAAFMALAVIIAGTAACSRTEDPGPERAPGPASTAPHPDSGSPRQGPEDVPHDDVGKLGDDVVASSTPAPVEGARPGRTRLQELYFLPHPVGSGPQIALRFMQALQAKDVYAAAAELYIVGRTHFATEDEAELRRVLGDVARNAGIQDAGICTSSRPLDATSSAVFCGPRAVLVHVLADRYGSGVQLSDRHPRFDVFDGPHTHAFTTLGP